MWHGLSQVAESRLLEFKLGMCAHVILETGGETNPLVFKGRGRLVVKGMGSKSKQSNRPAQQ